ENATFGLRAAAPALLCNDSLRLGKVLSCDPVNRKTWSCGHPPAMPGGCPKSAAVPCSCRPITGPWHSGTSAFDRWSDVRSGYMLLFGAEGASPKVWYPRNVNGPIRPTGICLPTVQHKAGGVDCRAEEMVSNVFHDFGPLVATEPAQKRFSGRLEVIDVNRHDQLLGAHQKHFPMLSPATPINDFSGSPVGSGSEVLGTEHIGLAPGQVGCFKKPDFSPLLLRLPLQGQDIERPVSVLGKVHD